MTESGGKDSGPKPRVTTETKFKLPWERAADAPQQPKSVAPLLPGAKQHFFQEIKGRVHRKLIERLNLSSLDKLSREQVVDAIRKVVHDLLSQESAPLNFEEREELVRQVLDEIFGLGPIEPLMQDPEVSDVLVNTYKQVYIERYGKLEPTDVRFQDDRHLLQVIDRIVSAVGRRIDDSSPMVDARLADGSRVNAIIKPLAIDGPHLSIRKFKRDALSGEDLLAKESLTEPMLELLKGLGRHRRRQDDAAQHSVVVHSGHRAHRHHRRLGRAPAQAAALRPAGDPAGQHRGLGRGLPAPAADQCAAYAPGPHHHG